MTARHQSKRMTTFSPNATGVGSDVSRTTDHAHAGGVAAKHVTRRGVSLIELMVVIAVITILFGMVGVVFHRLFLSEQNAMRAALTERTVSRLSDQFRRDVHAATTVERLEGVDGGQASRLILTPRSDSTAANARTSISYVILRGEVIRELFAGEQQISREVYRLPDCRIGIPGTTNETDNVMVSLVVERQGSTITPQPRAVRPWRSLVIEAALARDHRFAAAIDLKATAPMQEDSP